MTLLEYLKTNDISYADFAALIGAKSRATVYRYINRDRKSPSRKLMAKILEVTGGAVTANDFYDLPVNGHKVSKKIINKLRSN